jgi:putative FmdB family regulatory protein
LTNAFNSTIIKIGGIMPRYNYKCSDCGIFDSIVSYSSRETPQECPACGLDSPRTWEGVTINVSTEKLSQTMPEAVAKGRFNKLREQQAMNKEIAYARESGDRESEKKLKREKKKL